MAITITPSRTGMNVGLNDIAVILSEQNQVLAETAIAQQKLTNSFDSYLKMLVGDKMDELQEERRTKTEDDSKGKGNMSNMLGNIKPSIGGIFDYLKSFAKRLLPVALGLLFGDDLIRAATAALEKYLGIEISNDVEQMIMAATGGALLGFLFGGIKGGLFGLVLGAFTSEPVRKKIADTFNKLLGTELDENDWQSWGTGIIGALGFLWSGTLISGAFTAFFKSGAGVKASTGFAANLVKDIFKSQAFLSAIRFGMRGFLVGAIAYLAIQGGKALVDYFRGKNQEMFDNAIKESDAVIDEYQRTGDVNVLVEGREKIGKAQTEAIRMAEIGRGSGNYDEAQLQIEKTTKALGESGIDGQRQKELAAAEATRGNFGLMINKAYEAAMKKTAGKATRKDFQEALMDIAMAGQTDRRLKDETVEEYNARKKRARELISPDNREDVLDYMERMKSEAIPTPVGRPKIPNSLEPFGGSGASVNVVAPVDNSTVNQVTNNSSSPMVLPLGGSQDYDQFARRQMNATSP